MQKHGAAFNVTEEEVTKPPALGRAFDEARNVGHDEFYVIDADDAEIWVKRGKRIVRNLGPRIRGRRQERRLARIWQTQQTCIGDEFQTQPDRALDAFLAGVRAAWCLVGRGLKPQVAPAAIAAFGEQYAFTDLSEVRDQRLLVFIKDFGAHGHAQDDVIA